MRIVLCVAMVFASSSANAGEEMWNGIEAGMTRDKVEALFKDSGLKVKSKPPSTEIENVPIVGKCEAEAEVFYRDEVVDRIELKGEGSIAGRCADQVFAALASKYGQPDGQNARIGGGLFARTGNMSIWTRGAITLSFKQYNDNGLGGSGLAQHSWRLTYTTLAADINL
jgi:hypothetical protein